MRPAQAGPLESGALYFYDLGTTMTTAMKPGVAARPSRWAGFWFAQLLSAAFLASSLWWMIRDLAMVLPNHRITAALSLEHSLGSVLPLQLAAYAAALLLCHMLLGLAAFGLARLTNAALTSIALPRPRWLVSIWFTLLAGLVMAANSTRHPGSLFSGEESWLRAPLLAGLRTGDLLVLAFLVLVLLLAIRAAFHLRAFRPAVAVGFAGIGASVVTSTLLLPLVTLGSQASTASAAPHGPL